VLINQAIVALFALSVVAVALIVVWRFVRCTFQAVRAARYKFSVLSVVAILSLAALLTGVGLVWFGYGVAHSKKDLWTDLRVVLLTGLPFYGISYALWRMGRYFQAQLSAERLAWRPSSSGHPIR
jgi:hypothetical protein